MGIGPATEQDWPNCGQYGKLPPKRQLGDQTKHERSTMDLPGAGEDRGKEGNTPNEDSKLSRCQFVVREKLTQYRRMPG